MLPFDGRVQLNAAAAPIIRDPLTVAVTAIGPAVGTLGCSVRVMELPLADPVVVPTRTPASTLVEVIRLEVLRKRLGC
jgi:hypothetical protein